MSIIDRLLLLPVLNHWFYGILILAAMLEASPLFGLVVPGQLIMIIGGFLVKRGILDLGDTILFAALGAILGDLIGYGLGRKYGISFITTYGKYFFFRKEHFEKTKKVMEQHAGKTLILGRFNSLTRAFAPFVAGSTKIPLGKFLIYNVLGGIGWAVCFVLLGFWFGKSYETVSRYIGPAIILATVVSILFVYAYRFINSKKKIFTKYHLYALIFNILALYLFSKIVEDLIEGESMTKIDVWISTNIAYLWTPIVKSAMLIIANSTNVWLLSLLSILFLSVLLFRKKWYHSILFSLSTIGGLIITLITMFLLPRVSPMGTVLQITYYSFPSIQIFLATILCLMMIYSFKDEIKNKSRRTAFVVMVVVLFLIITFSRIYLNASWLSDVIAGFALGLWVITFFIIVLQVLISLSKRIMKIAKRRV